ncbi:hypothetical protein CCACVL1_28887 [Corchorus capsularis]|uniref:Uncharacterized protein n=1 Tax=Corchorus capsularis TaxID=210143 RepID=A0A1R3G4U0_COCAP|nr:hypothetical protein CCACVL1_28887 [Corchorus capsularis]
MGLLLELYQKSGMGFFSVKSGGVGASSKLHYGFRPRDF